MPRKTSEISEAELEIAKALWANGEPMNAQEVCGVLANIGWTYSTVSTLLGRMVEKGAVTYEKRGRFFYYSPTVSEDEYKQMQTKSFVAKLYGGSVKNLAVSLFKTGDLSANDIEEIKTMFNL
ncbi:MAG: BlaI/MecI/CopY family transcriptional regulator [Clostridiales bacterium]|nr:BlaI/MecI/CopY family transcriptional regulator [Clostridiales bacterium]